MNDFLTIKDFSPDQIRSLIDRAMEIKRAPQVFADSLKGRTLAMIFEKPSLRTRVTFDVGMYQLGGHSLYLSPLEINLGKRESIHDVAKNLERMVDAIMIRTFSHSIVEEMAHHASIPVINGLTDYSHPCQAMADYLTIFETLGQVSGKKIAFVGDGNNVARSLMFAGAQLGAHVWIATPKGYEPDEAAISWTTERVRQTGGDIAIINKPQEAVANADVVYTDVWASMGQEDSAAERAKIFRDFQINKELFSHAHEHAIFLHCLPAHRGDEVTADVIDSPRSMVFPQAENRLHAQKAILFELLTTNAKAAPSFAFSELAEI